jgi:hypothetical protein
MESIDTLDRFNKYSPGLFKVHMIHFFAQKNWPTRL